MNPKFNAIGRGAAQICVESLFEFAITTDAEELGKTAAVPNEITNLQRIAEDVLNRDLPPSSSAGA